MEKYRFFELTLFGDTVWLYLFILRDTILIAQYSKFTLIFFWLKWSKKRPETNKNYFISYLRCSIHSNSTWYILWKMIFILKLLRPGEKDVELHLYRCNKTRNNYIYIYIYYVKVRSMNILLKLVISLIADLLVISGELFAKLLSTRLT